MLKHVHTVQCTYNASRLFCNSPTTPGAPWAPIIPLRPFMAEKQSSEHYNLRSNWLLFHLVLRTSRVFRVLRMSREIRSSRASQEHLREEIVGEVGKLLFTIDTKLLLAFWYSLSLRRRLWQSHWLNLTWWSIRPTHSWYAPLSAHPMNS